MTLVDTAELLEGEAQVQRHGRLIRHRVQLIRLRSRHISHTVDKMAVEIDLESSAENLDNDNAAALFAASPKPP